MYDPVIARFMQEDTYRGDPNDTLSLNLYTYCQNEPIMYYDPSGFKAEGVVLSREAYESSGETSYSVSVLQAMLNELGYKGKDGNKLDVDGKYGKDTQYAVEQFQKSKGIDTDGLTGDDTWRALDLEFFDFDDERDNLIPYVEKTPDFYLNIHTKSGIGSESNMEYQKNNAISGELLKATVNAIVKLLNKGTGKAPEYEKKAGQKIIDNAQYIIDAANIYGEDPNVVAGVIYAEHSLNVDFKDSLTDWLGFYGVNTSIGLGQVRMSTAKLLEDLGYVPKSVATDGGWNVPFIGFVHGTENMAREKRLEDNKTNAIYVAAYIKLIEDTWEGEFPSISKRPDILGTLYNIGHDYSEPHSSPGANPFGKYVGDNYTTMEYLLKQK